MKELSKTIKTQTNIECIPHWQKEIANFTRQIEKLHKRM